ncbi:hypothetical protein [Bradyrhizobium sp. CCBAU 11386]|uniref:hypothetical protein n=1 Tax=Bradyrhizobium sp. CCBAU 11386 TaxID=1630837 RepID=UPI00230213CE|nr:hypothetical protein [Bradyrhizobium sp. CCBAU 11386]
MADIAARIADPDDLRFLIMLAAVLIVGVLAVVAGALMLPRDADGGFGFRWARRQ